MQTNTPEQTMQTLEVIRDVEIAAAIDIVFETVLEHVGPLNESPDGELHQLKLEAWPGGRWFRDFGNNTGHLWGHVHMIEPPRVLELHGPMFMSAPTVSHVMYRLSEENGATRLKFSHRAVGLIPQELMDGIDVNRGWDRHIRNLREMAEQRNRLSQ